jgi:hypothetical protein
MRSLPVLLSVFVLGSCSTSPAELAEQFKASKDAFEACKAAAYNDKALIASMDQYVPAEKLSPQLHEVTEKLNTTDLAFARLHVPMCAGTNEYDIEFIFEEDHHLEYKPCGDVSVSRNVHSEDGTIEYWGLDDQWFTWINKQNTAK